MEYVDVTELTSKIQVSCALCTGHVIVSPAGVITWILLCGSLDRKRTHFTVLAVHVSVTTSTIFQTNFFIVEVVLYPIRLAIVMISIIFLWSIAGASGQDMFIREFESVYFQSWCKRNQIKKNRHWSGYNSSSSYKTADWMTDWLTDKLAK